MKYVSLAIVIFILIIRLDTFAQTSKPLNFKFLIDEPTYEKDKPD
jgi:hypothetical protein